MTDTAGLFDTWASAGRGETMARGHWPMVSQILERMQLHPGLECLDVGCGNGYAVRAMADRVAPEGSAVGIDFADAMIREAENHPANPGNAMFLAGGADDLPFDDNRFDRILSVEAIYYLPDPLAALREWHRVLAPGGTVWVMVDYYRENPVSATWGELMGVPMQYLSEADYERLMTEAGFGGIRTERLYNPAPLTDEERHRFQPGWGYETPDDIVTFRTRIGSLLISAIKA